MYYVILMLVSVSGREIPQIYNNEPRQERFLTYNPVDNANLKSHQNGFVNTNNHAQYAQNNRELVNIDKNERPFVNPPLERNHRDRQENVNYHSESGFVSANNPGPFNAQNNRDFIPDHNHGNDRNWNPHANQNHFQVNLNNQKKISQGNSEFIPNDRLTSDTSGGHNQGNNAHNNREFIPSESNDRNYNPHTNQARPHAFNNEQYNDQNNRQFITNHDRRNDRTSNIHTNQGHSHGDLNHDQFNEQNNREFIPGDNINEQNNREIISSNKNNRNTNAYQGRSRDGGMSINLAFDRQNNNRREHSNLNIPHQTFNSNNEYSNRDTNRSTKNTNNENILHARRHQDEMTLEDYNRVTQTNHKSKSQEANNGMVSFLNNLNNTNQNPNRNHSGFRQINTKPKTAMENEVTPNPSQNANVEGDHRTVGNDWVWGVDDTTTIPPVTLDDRAAFSGDKCATGMVRFRGKCVTED